MEPCQCEQGSGGLWNLGACNESIDLVDGKANEVYRLAFVLVAASLQGPLRLVDLGATPHSNDEGDSWVMLREVFEHYNVVDDVDLETGKSVLPKRENTLPSCAWKGFPGTTQPIPMGGYLCIQDWWKNSAIHNSV